MELLLYELRQRRREQAVDRVTRRLRAAEAAGNQKRVAILTRRVARLTVWWSL